MMIAGVFALWLVFQLVAKYFKLWKENCRQIAAKLPPRGRGLCDAYVSLNKKLNYKKNGYIEN